MDEYKDMACAYRKIAEKEETEKERWLRRADLLDFLSECTEEDKQFIFDSGAFNEYMYGYLEKVLSESGVDEEIADNLYMTWKSVLDRISAAEVL